MTSASNVPQTPWSINLIRIVGYGLITFALIDLAAILLPPSFKDPSWEFQTLGDIVERAPVPMLGLLFIFYGELNLRKKWESIILKFLSWFTLGLSLLSMLFIGLGLNATLRLNNNATLQIDNARSQSSAQIQQAKDQLQSTSDQDLQRLIEQLRQAGRDPNANNPQELRDRFLTEIGKAEGQLKQRSDLALESGRRNLLKQSTKWNTESLISALIYFYLWRQTAWARQGRRRKKGKW